MALLWNGDFSSGDLSQYGAWEFGGTFDGNPTLSQRVTVGPSLDGITPPPPLANLVRVRCAPGDQYGNSTGWRTLARQHEPIQGRGYGYDSSYVMCVLLPTGGVGDADVWVCGYELHASSATQSSLFVNLDNGNAARVILRSGPGGGSSSDVFDGSGGITWQPNEWHVFCWRNRLGDVGSGHFELWHGVVGVHTTLVQRINLPGTGSGYAEGGMYPLLHLYRGQLGTSTLTAYFTGAREYSTLAEAKGFAEAILQGSGGSPPPPAPSLTNVGAWTTPLRVNSRTLAPTPTVFGTWTSPKLVRTFATPPPAPGQPNEGGWTTPLLTKPRGYQHQDTATLLITTMS